MTLDDEIELGILQDLLGDRKLRVADILDLCVEGYDQIGLSDMRQGRDDQIQ